MCFDELAKRNQQFWNDNVLSGDQYTQMWLDINEEKLEMVKQGRVAGFHNPVVTVPYDSKMAKINRKIYGSIEGKKILCLASGGGQQSVLFGLLGGNVTVLDLSEKQLECDKKAAEFYGYPINLFHGDMRDLGQFSEESFDFVYQPVSICFVPRPIEVYSEVYRILKHRGLYLVGHVNPATYPITFENDKDGWDGIGYRISTPYICGPIRKDERGFENMENGIETGEFRHSFIEIFGDLIEAGLHIEEVWEDTRHLSSGDGTEFGGFDHMMSVVQMYFSILSVKGSKEKRNLKY